ncbi:MAG TPA: cation diffusion facilitator family transporter [Bacteroidales bacterium]|nr:cation diffusion facilitator family transporter [Bacteroidales bacterium]
MEHAHHHTNISGKNILITIVLNAGITTAQLIGGLFSGSMALLSDAAHNFSDVISLVISYAAIRLSTREHSLKKTFGFKRAGVFAAFINTVFLLVVAVILILQAVKRLIDPHPVEGSIVIWLAAAGILLNGISMLFIRKDADHNLNIKSAFLHLLADMLTSVAVFAGGFIIKYLGWLWIDGVLTIVIAGYLIYSSWGIFYESIKIFMQFTPSHIDIEKVAESITRVEGISNVHHVHVWQLDEDEMIFEAHVDLEADYSISRFETILDKVEVILKGFGINHFNIQPELNRGDQKELINRGRN